MLIVVYEILLKKLFCNVTKMKPIFLYTTYVTECLLGCNWPMIHLSEIRKKQVLKHIKKKIGSKDFRRRVQSVRYIFEKSIHLAQNYAPCPILKGQLISKCLFGVFKFFQKTNKNSSHSIKNEFIHLFFGRIHDLLICFRNQLTFNRH